MPRLRFPPREPRQPDSSALPPELRWDAPQESVALLLSRRQFLRAAAVVLGLLALPYSRAERAWARAKGRFFTRSERATLDALCDRIIPPDDAPGAAALGAGRYIEIMLTAFDGGGTPRIYAGGPFSGRNPYPGQQERHAIEAPAAQLVQALRPADAPPGPGAGARRSSARRPCPGWPRSTPSSGRPRWACATSTGAASRRWTRSRRRRRARPFATLDADPAGRGLRDARPAAPSCPIRGAGA